MVVFCVFILVTTNRFFKNNTPTYKVFVFHLFFGVLSGIFAHALATVSSLLFGSLELAKLGDFDHVRRIFSEIDSHFLIYFSILAIVYIYHYYKQFRESELQRYEVSNKLILSNLNLIQSQLEPHFLFNTLNAISSLVYSDQKKAVKTITNLGDVLRDTLMFRDSQFIPIHDEIRYIKDYISILNVRFDDLIDCKSELSEGVHEMKVPALILQPIVENAIKHGFKNRREQMRICISIFLNDRSALVMKIRNSGRPLNKQLSPSDKGHYGLNLIRERLSLIYNDNFSFDLRNINTELYNVEVEIVIENPIESLSIFHNEPRIMD
jgi:hypothetical protein